MIRRVLFSRIGWMKYYDGPKPDDPKPIGGGSWNKKHKGEEMYNFTNVGGYVYGFCKPAPNTKRIALGRVQSRWQEDSLPNVLVVFVAVNPDSRGQRVVGWYREATLYQSRQSCNARKRRGKKGFYASTRFQDAVLLKPCERNWTVPAGRGGVGQANVCYLYDREGAKKKLPWANRIINCIDKWRARKKR